MEDAAAGASAAAGSSWHEQLTPANADGSTHTGAPPCAETDMDDDSIPAPADAPVSMRDARLPGVCHHAADSAWHVARHG